MKNIFKYILVFLSGLAYGQSPATFNFQGVLSSPESAFGSSVSMQIEITDAPTDGTVLFTETQSVAISAIGLFAIQVGASSDLESVDWSTGNRYLVVSVDGVEISTSEIVNVPQAIYANRAKVVTEPLAYDQLTGTPDFSQADTDDTDDFDGDYNSLVNAPATISAEESQKLGLITVENLVDLDGLSADVSANNEKVSFPGFGTTPGTAFIQKWHKIGNDVFLPDGSVGVSTESTDGEAPSLILGGASKLTASTLSGTPGTLYYDQVSGVYKYFDDQGEKDLIDPNSQLFGNGNSNGLDVNILGKLQVGSLMTSVSDATLTVASERPIIKFDDTSTSSSFPRNDWELVANGNAGEGNYFGVADATAVATPFMVKDANLDNAFFISENGDSQLGGNAPTAKLDMSIGIVSGQVFIGAADGLTGLSGSGTSSVTNTGSTTIESDNDGNLSGSTLFETASTTAIELDADGNVGVGTVPISDAVLSVAGNPEASNITLDPVYNGSLDVSQMNIVIFTASPGFSVFPFTSNSMQELTIINKSSSSFFVAVGSNPQIPQYGSITLLRVNNTWIIKYLSI